MATNETEHNQSGAPTLFSVADSPVSAVRAALAAVEPSGPGKPTIPQRYSRAQTERARRGIALARQELAQAA